VGSDGEEQQRPQRSEKKGKYRKDKPWDHNGIDHWTIPKFDKDDNKGGSLLEESSFATLFPKYRAKYLREVWPAVTRALKEHGVACELNLVEGSMTVRTTRKMWDPFIIMKARDLIKLLSRSVPAPQALKILQDDVVCDIIKIGNIIRNKEKFVKRRQRLIGRDGSTLKAIELLTECYILVQGNTVSAMGSYKGLKQVRRVVEDCIKNVHPIYHIKTMMIKRELAKDPALAGENWERFLPQFKKRNVQRKKPHKLREKKGGKSGANPFPPLPTPSKVDLQLESGEYFLSKEQKAESARAEKAAQQEERTAEARRQRQEAFVPPKEKAPNTNASGLKAAGNSGEDLKALASSLKKKAATRQAGGDGRQGGSARGLLVEARSFLEGGASMTTIAPEKKKKAGNKKVSKRKAACDGEGNEAGGEGAKSARKSVKKPKNAAPGTA